MGNCVFKGFGEVEEMVKVVTSNGGIMELYAPITAECITNEFPGHRIFRSQDTLSAPLLHKEELQAGELYYLLPLTKTTEANTSFMRHSSNKSSQLPTAPPPAGATYRLSFRDNHGMFLKRSSEEAAAAAEVFPRYSSIGVWKVRLVINPEQLSDILSQEARTEALIESVRTVAKCGTCTAATSGISSVAANSDQWSVASG